MGRSQGGNNNGYCQDNEISWFDWDDVDTELLDFTRGLVQFRRDHPVFRRRRFFQGIPIHGLADIGWFTTKGEEMSELDWSKGVANSLGVFLNGEALPSPDRRGQRVVDDSFLLLFNANDEPTAFALPSAFGDRWSIVLDTAEGDPPATDRKDSQREVKSAEPWPVEGRSVVVLIRID